MAGKRRPALTWTGRTVQFRFTRVAFSRFPRTQLDVSRQGRHCYAHFTEQHPKAR